MLDKTKLPKVIKDFYKTSNGYRHKTKPIAISINGNTLIVGTWRPVGAILKTIEVKNEQQAITEIERI